MKLSVILVISFEQPQTVHEALTSLFASEAGFAYEVIVVDNAAGEAAEALKAFAGRVKVIRNRENLGFTKANNRGAAAACGEYLLFLNSDTKVFPDMLSRLVGFADSRPETGAVGPLVLNGDGTFQLSFGRPFSLFSEFLQKAVTGRRSRKKNPESLRTGEKGWVSGCCLLTRREYFPGGKVFDEEIFLYFDDSELCSRLRKMGKKIFFFPAARIVHYGGASVRSMPARTALEYRKSQLHIYRKQRSSLELFLLKKYLKWKYAAKLKKASLSALAESEDERRAYRDILTLL
jgi:GT2 family glycosyltransferase